jgi:pectinesterase
MLRKITVDKNGGGDYTDVASAISAVESGQPTVIYIKNGVYDEKLTVDKPFVTIVGEDKEKTVLRFNDGANKLDENGEPIGTFKTASVKITHNAECFEAYNLTFENNAGLGSVAGQAVALYLDCDKAIIKDCRLIAKQDTLLTGPMFLDIEENPRLLNRQYFKNCYIEGDVDFIFGGAAALFEDCEIFALARPKELHCYVTAACTSKESEFGYIFRNCHLTGSAEEDSVYLGRPWREYANVAYINCELDKCMNKQGFCKWNKTERHLTARYFQYGSRGEGYDESQVEDWTRVLDENEASKYLDNSVFGDWTPTVKDYEVGKDV